MKTIPLLIIGCLLISGRPQQENTAAGKKLFYENCSPCHSINSIVIGPALKNIESKRDSAWLYKWIRSSQSLIRSKDTAAVSVFNRFNKVMQPDFKFSDKEIGELLDYIKTESKSKNSAVKNQ